MGLGKTLTALTSILDGRQMDPSVKEAPTLVVVPSHLVEHWYVVNLLLLALGKMTY